MMDSPKGSLSARMKVKTSSNLTLAQEMGELTQAWSRMREGLKKSWFCASCGRNER